MGVRQRRLQGLQVKNKTGAFFRSPILENGQGIADNAIEIVGRQIEPERIHIRQQVLHPLLEAVHGIDDVLERIPGSRRLFTPHLNGGPNAGQRISDVVGDIANQFAERGKSFGLNQTGLAGSQFLCHPVDGPRQIPHLVARLPDNPVLEITRADDGR